MANDILKNIPLPADLPENWTSGQIIAPTGAEAGLDNQHGYNYLMMQVNNAQRALKALAAQREEDLARIKFWVSNDPTSPASFIGGTWERIAQDCALMGASDTHSAGTTASAGLPNISGEWGNIRVPSNVREGSSLPDSDLTGVFKKTIFISSPLYTSIDGTDVFGWDKLNFSASESNPLYGASDTVQPPAYYAYIWRRIA